MVIYVLRHGIAENVSASGSDADRALTKPGKQKLRRVLECARQAGVRPALILTSPLKRAVQTAEMAADILKVTDDIATTKALLPTASPQALWTEVARHKARELAIAGHEPQLSKVVGFLLHCAALRLDLKKGALVCIDVETAAAEPHGTLKWILT